MKVVVLDKLSKCGECGASLAVGARVWEITVLSRSGPFAPRWLVHVCVKCHRRGHRNESAAARKRSPRLPVEGL